MTALSTTAKVWIALASVYVVWGSTYLAIKYVVETMPPLMTAGVRFFIAGAVMYAVGLRTGDRSDRPTAQHWRSAVVIGAALILGGNGLVMLAEKRGLASGTTALLIATVPLWLALFDRVRFGARMGSRAVAGLVVGFAGTALLVRQPGEAVELRAALYAVAASAIWAAGSLFARGAPLPKRPWVSTGMEMMGGGVAAMLAGIATGELGGVTVGAFSTASLIAFAYLIVFGSWVGFTAYVWLLRNVRTTIAGTYAYVNPLVAVLLGFLFRGERLTPTTAIAGLVIVSAVALIVTTGRTVPDEDENADLASEQLPT